MRAVGNGWDMDDHEETREALLSHYLFHRCALRGSIFSGAGGYNRPCYQALPLG
jgi:hypothetical protein